MLKTKCHGYEDLLVEQSELIDGLEQYSRRNCALIHGIPEDKAEKTDNVFIETISQHLGVNLKAEHLDRTHRLGAPKKMDLVRL